MNRHVLVLRPEPGASRTAARLAALNVPTRCCPLFTVAPVPWVAPDADRYDALLLTSANAARQGGPALRALASLPVLAVGEATAAATRAAGLTVAMTGRSDAATLLADAAALMADARAFTRILHLAGRHRLTFPDIDQITVYASELLPIGAEVVRGWEGQLALLHSPRAARRFAELVDRHGGDRATIGVAALGAAVAAAAGDGWAIRAAVAVPDDAALAALGRELIDQPWRGADKCRP